MRLHPTPRPRSLRAFLATVVLLLTMVTALTAVSSASAATPCGKKVLGDWFDNGRIDKIYPLNCYEEAIDSIPADLRDYADAEDVITRALQLALHGKVGAQGKDPSNDSGKNGGTSGGKTPGGNSSGDSTDKQPPQAAPDVSTSGPSSVPIPLLVLGGLSLALLAAGGLGYVSRRRQAARALEPDDSDPFA